MKEKFASTYKSTIVACYIGNVTMGAVTNFLPVIFITLRNEFGLTYTQLGALTFINFATQVVVDFIVGSMVDKYGFRRFIVSSTLLTIIGFSLFAAAPCISAKPYPLFVVATIIYSGSCGLLELLLSPIVNSVPIKEKTKALSMLHSFYCWGVVFVVLLSTLLLHFFGNDKWQIVMVMWVIIPAIDFLFFIRVPLMPPLPEEKRQGIRQIAGKKIYALLCLIIFFGAASELVMEQWASAFVEEGLGVSKVVGDIVGVCGFATLMGIGRVLLAKWGESEKVNLGIVLICTFTVAMACYIAAALSENIVISLLACAMTGLAISMMWPGTLIDAAKIFPLAGAWMFAVLSGFGDLGGAAAPWLSGKIADAAQTMPFAVSLCSERGLTYAQFGLKAAMLFSALFPMLGIVCSVLLVISLRRRKKAEADKTAAQ